MNAITVALVLLPGCVVVGWLLGDVMINAGINRRDRQAHKELDQKNQDHRP